MTKPKIICIAAVARNGAMGVGGTLPWSCPADMRHFQRLTMGKVVLMGRKTADSLSKPLRGRVNVVMTRSGVYARPGFVAVSNHRGALRAMRAAGQSELWVIGGAGMYAKYIPKATLVHLTQLDIDVPHADTWFPMDALSGWHGAVACGTTTDPAVHFWVFTPDGPRTMRAASTNAVYREMDIDQPTGVYRVPCAL